MKTNNKGITLIALVITIIVLLILAGVSIAMLTGDNGMLTKASDAKIVNEIGARKDLVNLAAAEGISDFYESEYVSKDDSLTDIETAVIKRVKARCETTTGEYTITVDEEAGTVTIATTIEDKTNLKSVGTIKDKKGAIVWTDTFKSE